MISIQEYIQQQREEISNNQKEVDILEASGLDLFVEKNIHGIRQFETRDYSLADRVKIENLGKYSVNYDFIHFIHDIITPCGNLAIYCRHDSWHRDDVRYAQRVHDDGFDTTKRHNIEELVDFYRQQGVKERLLVQLREKIEDIYKEPTPYETLRELDPKGVL